MKHVTIYARGICGRGWVGGYGVILIHNEHRKELSKGFQQTTNNRMDIHAAIAGLRALKEPCHVSLYNTNGYLVDAIAHRWIQRWKANNWTNREHKTIANADLWEKLLGVSGEHQIECRRLRDKAQADYRRCDKLARRAANNSQLPVDEEEPR